MRRFRAEKKKTRQFSVSSSAVISSPTTSMQRKEKNSSSPQKNNKCGGLVRQSRNIEMQALVLNIEPRCVSSSRSVKDDGTPCSAYQKASSSQDEIRSQKAWPDQREQRAKQRWLIFFCGSPECRGRDFSVLRYYYLSDDRSQIITPLWKKYSGYIDAYNILKLNYQSK